MSTAFESLARIWNDMQGRHTPLPSVATVAPARCSPKESAGYYILRDKMYFSVRISEMHLKENSQWYKVYDPLVFIVAGFNHGNERVTVPAVIGPGLIQKQAASDIPKYGSVLLDTRVTGPHPYRGGDVDISVSFYKVQRIDYARTLFKIVETLSGALGMAGEVATVAKTGAALLEGVEGLLGLKETIYLSGHRMSLAPSPVDPLSAGFSALIAPPAPPDPSRLCVVERRLHVEKNNGQTEPYRDSDFVLLSVSGSKAREDENLLPFYSLKRDAMSAVWEQEGGIKRGKANLIAAYQQMRESPEVTEAEASALFDKWLEEFEREMDRVEKVRAMAIESPERQVISANEEMDDAARRIGL